MKFSVLRSCLVTWSLGHLVTVQLYRFRSVMKKPEAIAEETLPEKT